MPHPRVQPFPRLALALVVPYVVAVAGDRAASPPVHTAMAQPSWERTLDSVVQSRAAADSFSGVVLVARDGRPVYQRAVGLADRAANVAMRLDTKLQNASVTKLYTQIAIQQLVQAGRVALADTVGKFLPNYPNAVVRSRVTVEQLLRHRSGVGSFFNPTFLARRASVRTVSDYMALFQDDSLLFEPGTSQVYSNGGYVLLGAIIERVSGQPYHEYLREHVFGPAGMTETVPYDGRVPAANAAVGYTFQPLGGLPAGDTRLAGSGPRPGYENAPTGPRGEPAPRPAPPPAGPTGSEAGPRLMLMGPDGRPLSAAEARDAMARRGPPGDGTRRPNTAIQPGMSSPAGDMYSTVGDFLKLATALTSHRLLDAANTRALLGASYAAGNDFRFGGGGPGVNAELSVFANGHVMIVLANYDPPAATIIAQQARALLATPATR